MEGSRFYIVHSRKSEEVTAGLRQITLGCENRADAHGFFWIDAENQIQQIQFIFDEVVLEWIAERGIECSRTNRALEMPTVIGIHKGSRSLHKQRDTVLLEHTLEEVLNAEFPPQWSARIREKFT